MFLGRDRQKIQSLVTEMNVKLGGVPWSLSYPLHDFHTDPDMGEGNDVRNEPKLNTIVIV